MGSESIAKASSGASVVASAVASLALSSRKSSGVGSEKVLANGWKQKSAMVDAWWNSRKVL